MNILYRLQRKTKFILRSKILKEEFIFTRGGIKLKLNVSRDVDKHYYWGEFEKDTITFFDSLINEDQIIFDVGANIGIYSIIAAIKSNKRAKIFSFEPSDWAFDRLVENSNLNNCSNIIPVKMGVSNKKGTVSFFKCKDDAYNSIGSKPMMEVEEILPIKVVSLDEFCYENQIQNISILKIDAEGADFLVLKGAQNLLSKKESPVIFCEYNRKISEGFNFSKNDFVDYLTGLNYSLYELHNKKLRIFNSETSSSNEIICLKNEHLSMYNLKITHEK